MTDELTSLREEVDRLIARTRPGYSGRTRWGFADAVTVFASASEVAWSPKEQLEVLSQLGRYMGHMASELRKSVAPLSHSTVNEAESPALAALLCIDEDELTLDPAWVAKAWSARAGALIALTVIAGSKLLPDQVINRGMGLPWTAHLQAMDLYQRKMVLDY